MIKKILKAIVLGLRESETIKEVIRMTVVLGWLPGIVTIILIVLQINLSNVEQIFTIFGSIGLGTIIYWYIARCIEVVKYQEENNCTFKEAWGATGTYEIDD